MDDQISTSNSTNISGDINTGSGDFIGRDKVIIDLFSLQDDFIRIFNSLVISLQKDKPANNQTLFEHHIEPTFRKLEIIHDNYEKTLFELKAKLLREEIDFQNLFNWLHREQYNYRSDRLYLKQVNVEFDALLSHLSDITLTSGGAPWSSRRKSELVVAIEEFSDAVTRYFMFRYQLSIYSLLDNCLETIIRERGNRELQEEIKVVRVILDEILDDFLPRVWKDAIQAYLKLRGLCLI